MAKILFTIGSLELGGAESQMALLIDGLTRNGHRCEVVALSPHGPLRDQLAAKGVPVHGGAFHPGDRRRRKIMLLPCAFLSLWWRAIRFRPDALHAYLPLTNLLGALAGRLALVPVIVTSRRALGKHQDASPWWRPFDRLANALSTVVTVNSCAVAEDTIARDGVSPAKLHHIPNGLDFSRFDGFIENRQETRASLGLAPDQPAIVVVGNLIAYKGHADLIEAIARLKPRAKPARFVLIGQDRGIGEDLAARADELGIQKRISFQGCREDVPAILAAADGFVLPSHQEGFSNALLEAMASGLPIVATDVGGNGEALERGRFGVLVPPHDPEALAAAIDAMLDAPDAARELGRSAALAVRARYSTEAMIRAHMALYRVG